VRERRNPPADSIMLWRQGPIGHGSAEKSSYGVVPIRPNFSLSEVLIPVAEIYC
jgi:hypothetical protein